MVRLLSRSAAVQLVVGLVLLTALCAAGVAASPDSGIAGRVQEGPTCPVESHPPDPNCAPRPLSAWLRVYPPGDSTHYVLVHSGRNGQFRVALDPGTYVVHAQRFHGSGSPRPPAPFRVHVRDDHLTHVTVDYDTGIR